MPTDTEQYNKDQADIAAGKAVAGYWVTNQGERIPYTADSAGFWSGKGYAEGNLDYQRQLQLDRNAQQGVYDEQEKNLQLARKMLKEWGKKYPGELKLDINDYPGLVEAIGSARKSLPFIDEVLTGKVPFDMPDSTEFWEQNIAPAIDKQVREARSQTKEAFTGAGGFWGSTRATAEQNLIEEGLQQKTSQLAGMRQQDKFYWMDAVQKARDSALGLGQQALGAATNVLKIPAEISKYNLEAEYGEYVRRKGDPNNYLSTMQGITVDMGNTINNMTSLSAALEQNMEDRRVRAEQSFWGPVNQGLEAATKVASLFAAPATGGASLAMLAPGTGQNPTTGSTYNTSLTPFNSGATSPGTGASNVSLFNPSQGTVNWDAGQTPDKYESMFA